MRASRAMETAGARAEQVRDDVERHTTAATPDQGLKNVFMETSSAKRSPGREVWRSLGLISGELQVELSTFGHLRT